MLTLFLSAFSLGIFFCAPPGVVAAQALRSGLARGFRGALLVELGSLSGDATWAVIALVGAAFLVQNAPVRLILSVCGILLLLYLAWSALRDAVRGTALEAKKEVGAHSDLISGALLSLTNPYAVVFWLGLSGSVVAAGNTQPGPADFVIFFCGFMGGSLLWCFFMAALIAFGKRYLRPSLFRWINAICGVALLYFAFRLLATMLP